MSPGYIFQNFLVLFDVVCKFNKSGALFHTEGPIKNSFVQR